MRKTNKNGWAIDPKIPMDSMHHALFKNTFMLMKVHCVYDKDFNEWDTHSFHYNTWNRNTINIPFSFKKGR